jgi:hypothetical protein
MGTWGLGTFENDTAADWMAALESRGAPLVAGTLESVANADEEDYVDADAASEALAAAELVAAAHKDDRSRLPKALADWCLRNDADIVRLTPSAARAVRRVLSSSELVELWDEGDEGAAWRESVEALIGMLER